MTDLTQTRPGHPIADLAWRLAERNRNRRLRHALRQLERLDDTTLNDIGVTRGEIGRALRLPLDLDPGTALRRMSFERLRRGM